MRGDRGGSRRLSCLQHPCGRGESGLRDTSSTARQLLRKGEPCAARAALMPNPRRPSPGCKSTSRDRWRWRMYARLFRGPATSYRPPLSALTSYPSTPRAVARPNPARKVVLRNARQRTSSVRGKCGSGSARCRRVPILVVDDPPAENRRMASDDDGKLTAEAPDLVGI